MGLSKRARVIGISLATAAVVGAGAVAAFSAGATGSSSGTVTAAFAKTSDWGTGFQGQYTIANGSGQPVHNWTVSFDLPAGERISSLWDGTMTAAGQHITVTSPTWGADIATGTSTTFGFVVDATAGSATPLNCLINGAACTGGAPGGGPTSAPGSGSSAPSSAPSSSAAPTGEPSGKPSSAPSSAPSSVPTSAPSSVPAPPAAGGSYSFAPYVDTAQRQDLGAIAAAAGTKYVTGAFVLASGSGCAPAWNGTADPTFETNLKAGIADLRAKGGDVIASFGGANGTELAQACTDVPSLKAAYKSVIDTYNLTHVDFDIEGAAGTDQASITRRAQALAQLQSDYAAAGKTLSVSLTLPVLPSGLTADGLNVVSAAAKNGLKVSVVNVMAMDYGDWAAPSPAGKMGQYADQAGQSLHDQLKTVYPSATDAQLWAMVGITPMIGVNDTNDEVFQVADAKAVEQFAAQHHIGRLAMWSLTRDQACAQPSSWASPTCSSIQQGAYDFSHTFEAFSG
ncbi:cellulose binding domain-containing protein [Catenulispora sp. NF23]|uniref:cellulose binding domain-containing protein n=1 Tax=Catenulispora pinistramenti TaxID=2705254 RepID=UPI001BAC4797|nr:cellulose binding domain-containing protein [Catenulispora pinistramenti]MBS2532513.1 cellulose binding domain-containing protein [Catenulispora pinistramenti]